MEDVHNFREKGSRYVKEETIMDNNSLISSTKLSPGQVFPKALPMSRCAKRSSCATRANRLQMQVCLYNWSLIRVDGDHPNNDSSGNEKLVTLEGYTTSDLNDHDIFRTAPIETRIGKLKLKTVDGMNIFLKSMIDEQRSFENGFPLPVIHFFLTGFPLNWKNVLNMPFGQTSSNEGVLQASKEESVWQEKNETQNLGCTETYLKNMGTGKSNLLEEDENIIKVEEKLPKVTAGESLARGRKRGRNGSQRIQSSKRLKCGNLSTNSKPKVSIPSGGSVENYHSSRSVKKKRKDTTKDQMSLRTEDYQDFERDDHLAESDSKLLRRKSLNFSVSHEDRDSVKCKENIVYDVLTNMKIKSETERSPLVNVHLRHFESNSTPGGEQIEEIQMPLLELGKPMPLDSSVAKRNRMKKSVRLEITDEVGKRTLDVEHESHSDNIICTRASAKKCKKNIVSPSDSEFTAIPNETCLPSSAENKPFPLPENHLKSNVTKRVKHVNKLGTERSGRSRPRTRCTDQSPQLSDAFLCHETNLNDNAVLKCNDISASCITTSDKGPSTIEHVTASENRTETGENSPKANGNGEGSMQTPKTRMEINMQTKTKKRQLLNNIALTPTHLVHTTPEEVSKAFGLKTSRSGRLLVPPLAHWCNQKIAYDMDGGIIAILDASSQRDKNYGSLIFMPPEQKDAISIRKKLCDAANEINLTLTSSKKACKERIL